MQPKPNYRWQCHRCRTINEPGVERCSACGFAAHATGYEILGQKDPLSASMSESNQLLIECIARVIHIVAASLFLSAGGWSLFFAATFNPWVFWAGLLIGMLLFAIGIFGSRKAVFVLLSVGWV